MASQAQPFHWHYTEVDDKNFQVHGRTLLFTIIIFSLFVFFTLLCLYAKWVCRYRQRFATANANANSNANAAVFSTSVPQPAAPPLRSIGLDPATIHSLPIFLHRSSTSLAEETQCSICITTFEDQEKVKVLPQCRHSFHPDCVDKWLSTQSSCPLCRASLRAEVVCTS